MTGPLTVEPCRVRGCRARGFNAWCPGHAAQVEQSRRRPWMVAGGRVETPPETKPLEGLSRVGPQRDDVPEELPVRRRVG